MRKYCRSCGKNRPMYMYHSDDSKYQIKSNNGKVIECRICTFKRAKIDGGLMQRLEGKFVFIPMGNIETIKYIFKK
jgi:hypothetical protein